jgi:hypothetical protein
MTYSIRQLLVSEPIKSHTPTQMQHFVQQLLIHSFIPSTLQTFPVAFRLLTYETEKPMQLFKKETSAGWQRT